MIDQKVDRRVTPGVSEPIVAIRDIHRCTDASKNTRHRDRHHQRKPYDEAKHERRVSTARHERIREPRSPEMRRNLIRQVPSRHIHKHAGYQERRDKDDMSESNFHRITNEPMTTILCAGFSPTNAEIAAKLSVALERARTASPPY